MRIFLLGFLLILGCSQHSGNGQNGTGNGPQGPGGGPREDPPAPPSPLSLENKLLQQVQAMDLHGALETAAQVQEIEQLDESITKYVPRWIVSNHGWHMPSNQEILHEGIRRAVSERATDPNSPHRPTLGPSDIAGLKEALSTCSVSKFKELIKKLGGAGNPLIVESIQNTLTGSSIVFGMRLAQAIEKRSNVVDGYYANFSEQDVLNDRLIKPFVALVPECKKFYEQIRQADQVKSQTDSENRSKPYYNLTIDQTALLKKAVEECSSAELDKLINSLKAGGLEFNVERIQNALSGMAYPFARELLKAIPSRNDVIQTYKWGSYSESNMLHDRVKTVFDKHLAQCQATGKKYRHEQTESSYNKSLDEFAVLLVGQDYASAGQKIVVPSGLTWEYTVKYLKDWLEKQKQSHPGQSPHSEEKLTFFIKELEKRKNVDAAFSETVKRFTTSGEYVPTPMTTEEKLDTEVQNLDLEAALETARHIKDLSKVWWSIRQNMPPWKTGSNQAHLDEAIRRTISILATDPEHRKTILLGQDGQRMLAQALQNCSVQELAELIRKMEEANKTLIVERIQNTLQEMAHHGDGLAKIFYEKIPSRATYVDGHYLNMPSEDQIVMGRLKVAFNVVKPDCDSPRQ